MKSLDWTAFEKGMADTWMGGEPDEAAMVIRAGSDFADYPDNVVAWLNKYMAPKEQNAYAVLFAASPDLLAACENALAALRWAASRTSPMTTEFCGVINQLNAAIAKAKGEHL